MDMDERWLNRSPEVMVESFHAFRGEAFELIVEDLLSMPQEPLVLVEGFKAPARARGSPAERLEPGGLADPHA